MPIKNVRNKSRGLCLSLEIGVFSAAVSVSTHGLTFLKAFHQYDLKSQIDLFQFHKT